MGKGRLMYLTVGELKEALEGYPEDTVVVNIDSRSGVVNEAYRPHGHIWTRRDNDYGVELPLGKLVVVIGT